MLTQKNNIHHSKIPKIGDIGYLISGVNRLGDTNYFRGKRQKYIVSHYPLNDNISPFSRGIHTAFFKNLGNGKVIKLSGFYFESLNF